MAQVLLNCQCSQTHLSCEPFFLLRHFLGKKKFDCFEPVNKKYIW